MVVHSCNPNYSEGGYEEDHGSRSSWAIIGVPLVGVKWKDKISELFRETKPTQQSMDSKEVGRES
jgi:hypothetical protein